MTGQRLGLTARLVLLAWALALAGVLGVARWLTPNPKGHGTHTQLNLPPCSFLIVTGYPCPSCGMTTAFAWAMRGRLDLAWKANPAGCLMASSCLLLIPWMLASALGGRAWGLKRFSLDWLLVVLVVASVASSLAAWAVRLTLGRVIG